ncbi:uncharacterized protein PGTG_14928 [Puccinia graminis f. sp. tritici CRL 75-36-700-3]|uniref:Uncharacterized protein n=1 Tax=Puccinia graminis f. sp. tritici (strain CRL 75-36-700-3 / race SCCL) TaxID=418459 RepID=E3KXM5_PUCGT|nr:uncharacterized protein PGTG_14928 [Puccinia graminis f. sp. tritici CRL 75-36-700-3]EFP89087.2 hypothetical protein PGTG_14928 [Puccinia graminis f. sp. tritici CRL 75-36-700-3]
MVIILLTFTCNIVMQSIAMYDIPNPGSLSEVNEQIHGSYLKHNSTISGPSQEKSDNPRNVTVPTNQDYQSILQGGYQPHLGEKRVSDLTDKQFNSVFCGGDSGEAQRKELEKITDTLHRLREARDNPQVLEAHQALKLYLWKEIQQAENLLENMRAWLIGIFDQKDLEPDQFKLAKELKKGLRREEEQLWENIWKSEEEDYRFKRETQGFFGYFYSLWKFFFANQHWESQQLRQSLRKILSQLPHRVLMEEERIIMQLEKVQKAGFQITWQEQQLARKISEMSQKLSPANSDINYFIPLDLDEGTLLETIGHRTVAVRRQEQVHGLEEKLRKTLKTDQLHGINPDDQKFILNELQELIKKEKDGLGWTDDDVEWMKSLENESKQLEKKKISKLHQLVAALKIQKLHNKKSRLSQLATDLQIRKAFNVLEANAHHPMTPEKLALHLKLGQKITNLYVNSTSERLPHQELTASEIKEIKQLARHYDRMKEQLKFPLHPDLKEVTRKQLENELLSPEKAAMHRLNQMKYTEGIDSNQHQLLDKLEHGIKHLEIGPEELRWAENHRKRRLAISQSDKAKEVEQILKGTPEYHYISGPHGRDIKVELYNKAIYFTPLWEFRVHHKPTDLIKGMLIPPESKLPAFQHLQARFLTFAERCKVLIHSHEFQAALKTPAESLEGLALERLHHLIHETHAGLNPFEAKIHHSLSSNKYEDISTTEAKDTIKKLAVEQKLIKTFRPSKEDKELANKLAKNIKLAELNQADLEKLKHLLPDELNQLGGLISTNQFGHLSYEKFKKSSQFFKIVQLLQNSSDRIKFKQNISINNDSPMNLFSREAKLQDLHNSKFLSQISKIKNVYHTHFQDKKFNLILKPNLNDKPILSLNKSQKLPT